MFENLTINDVWLYAICITVSAFIIYILLKKQIKLGFKCITTWREKSTLKLHEEYGEITCIWSTFIFGFMMIHIMYIPFLWVFAILWSFDIFGY